MASVTSLDQDMKRLRLGKYTPQAANEVRSWIEDTLGERLPPGDLLDALKDGTVLCRLVNLAVPNPGVKFKKSPMPFIQMENISHFLHACEQPPLSMPSHDRFLTVDLYESKDPAQVLQCLSAFSRVANAINPSRIPTTIGPKRSAGPQSPSATGSFSNGKSLSSPGPGRSRGISTSSAGGSTTFNPLSKPAADRALSPTLTGGSNTSKTSNGIPKSPPGGVSSWSKKADEGVTAPAWNIHQYGYMGGASQGNQGIAFGARRQITSAGPHVPNAAEKERKRKEKEAEEQRLRQLAEEAENKRRIEREAEEERQRLEEERRWEEETRKQREAEQRRLEQQKREWEEQERRWKLEEEQRQREEREAQERLEKEARRKRAGSDARLRGQYLSQYQAEQGSKPRSRRNSQNDPDLLAERERIQELERQLEEAKERERLYQLEREERLRDDERRKLRSRSKSRTRERSRSRPRPPPRAPSPQDSQASWSKADERDYLRKQWNENQSRIQQPRPLPEEVLPTGTSVRPLPEPSRPLPDPAAYAKTNRTDRYLASNPVPTSPKPATHIPPELTSTSERAAEDARRAASQAKTKAGGWASKSLLEREMERERERQREWEEAQKALKNAPRDPNAGSGEGQSWDVNQYGYTGGDSQNRVGTGIGFGGRRQILGPRPFGPR
ncbi:uncharacterized protein EI97DRAFT_397656 [Westerdykella ornata]|uniref:Calponin-homology (CH) domain-containing protein n=1 Tax=Westerdykella ornata TaxID=318751 RepID=A0A6A6JP97_WESOR|nr:uncharacterized protein EI97DRAFT_397656 [Westerdykella ornata]KAF2276769.1 hypothetical protein EI97DRAFT_397656 [Westerdykella ornata]